MLEIQSLLQPVSNDAPAGADLEYSAELTALQLAAQGKPARQIGDAVQPAEPPDWNAVVEQSTALLRTSKDLRVATELVRAQLQRNGFSGLTQGLALVRGLVETFWPVFHPQLEDGDPTARINVMASLTHRDMVQAVRTTPLVKSRAVGSIALRDVDAANGRPRDGSAGPPPSWDAMLEAMPLPELVEAAQAVDACDREARELELAWKMLLDGGAHSYNGGGKRLDDFSELRQVLTQANRFMKERVDHRQPSGAAQPIDGNAPAPQSVVGGTRNGVSLTGEVRSRDDVLRALDAICAYYARNEPSSPVPLLVERCKRLVAMSFVDIVKDMMPDGLPALQTIAGTRNE
jgi:type VI secretion system protein ImpA